MECILSPYEDFRDRIVRRHLIGVHSIRSNPDSKDQNPHKNLSFLRRNDPFGGVHIYERFLVFSRTLTKPA